MLRKGLYPYEYVDSFQKFHETELPPTEAFYNTLQNESFSLEDYAHAQAVCAEFHCQSLGGLICTSGQIDYSYQAYSKTFATYV